MVERWSDGEVELNRDSEILSCRDAEREKGNGGVVEWWRDGVMERWNDGEVELNTRF